MFRKLTSNDKKLYFEFTDMFYKSDAVLHPVSEQNIVNTFNELMRSDEYLVCYVFENNGEAVGYALISKTFSQESGGLVVWVEELFVLPEYRSMGFGSQFLNFLETDIPASRYRLEIEPDNQRAAALYKRMGYKFLPYSQMVKDK